MGLTRMNMDKERGMVFAFKLVLVLLLLLLMNQQSFKLSFMQEPRKLPITATEALSNANWARRMLSGRSSGTPIKPYHHMKHHHTYSSSTPSNYAGALGVSRPDASDNGNTKAADCISSSPHCANNGTAIDPRYGVEKRLVPTGPNPLHN